MMMKENLNLFFMFCGQGSQYAGMGSGLLEADERYLSYLERCSEYLGEDLKSIVFDKNGKGSMLQDTRYSQLAIYSLSTAIGDYLKNELSLGTSDVNAVIGHSLGDYSALEFCGFYDFKKGLDIVNMRSELMSRANRKSQGMMAAVLGVGIGRLSSLLEKSGRQVYIANHNDNGQIVISGLKKEIIDTIGFLKDNDVRKIIPLKVNIASHCPLMREVSDKLYEYVENKVVFNDPLLDFYSSTELKFIGKDDVAQCLRNQLTNPIRWVESIERIIKDDSIFIEVGPGKVLSKILKSLIRHLKVENIKIFDTDSMDNIQNAIDHIKEVK